MTEDDLRAAMARFHQEGEHLAKLDAERIERRDTELRRARTEGWRNVDIERITGLSREAVRQALNPQARTAARKATADRRAALKPTHPNTGQ